MSSHGQEHPVEGFDPNRPLTAEQEALAQASYFNSLAHYAISEVLRLESEVDGLREENIHLYDLAHTDELTGLSNRRQFVNTLERHAEQTPGKFAAVFIDLNGLKRVNDTEGHEAGNDMLRVSGATMDENTRQHETAEHPEPRAHDVLSKLTARLSGDEFAIVLTDVDTEEKVEAFIQRLESALASKGISAAIGGRVHRIGETGLQLLQAVDGLMYSKKQAGRLEAKVDRLAQITPERMALADQIRGLRDEGGFTNQEIADILDLEIRSS